MSKQYTDPKKRYENERSTAVMFLIMGSIGTVAILLCFLNILKFPFSNFQLGIFLLMFLGFLGVGVWSSKNAAKISKTISSEETQLREMRQWIAENKESFCKKPDAELDETEIFFQRETEIRLAISEKFPQADESLLEFLTEETYQSLFES